jgi:hypothetical protein
LGNDRERLIPECAIQFTGFAGISDGNLLKDLTFLDIMSNGRIADWHKAANSKGNPYGSLRYLHSLNQTG